MDTCAAGVGEAVIVRHTLVTLEPRDARSAVALRTGDVARTVVRPDRIAVTFLASCTSAYTLTVYTKHAADS